MFDIHLSTPRSTLSPQKELELATFYLENARKAEDQEIALAVCDDAEAALSRMKRAAKESLKNPLSVEDQALRDGVATAYLERGNLLKGLGYITMAQISYRKAEKWGHVQRANQPPSDPSSLGNNKETNSASTTHRLPSLSSPSSSQVHDLAHVPPNIFDQDVAPAVTKYDLPETGARLNSTLQLAYCLSLLPSPLSLVRLHDEAERAWSRTTVDDEDEQERLRTLATNLTKAYISDVLKSASTVTEVVCLVPALDQEHFRRLLMNFIDGINQATLLELHLLEGLAQLMQCASPGYLDANDLVRILDVLTARLKDTHQQSTQHIHKLTLVVSHVLDAMVDCHVEDLNRVQLHEPLSEYLIGLKSSSDPYLVYQSAYAFQALQYVPDDESPLQATLRRTRIVAKGISGIVSATKAFDIIDGLAHLQNAIVEVYQVAKIGYNGAKAFIESGQDFLDCLKEGQSFAKKRAWYPALRGIDDLIRLGQFPKVKKLICEAPFRRDVAFQWGVCQRLGEIAANPLWNLNTRQNAVDFLGELYKNDTEWGQQAMIKQWILNILEQLASQLGSTSRSAETLLHELGTDGDVKKQRLYQTCRREPQHQYPLTVTLPLSASPSLLDRVQNKLDIEVDLRRLKLRRLNERGDGVYIPLQAKSNLQAPDDALFSLIDKVNDFLNSDQKVLLLLGDSGSGKSTFNRALEYDLWSTYKKKDGRIPLFVNLTAINKPEQDLITKHLRKAEFTDHQIRELKSYRRFVLICDGYDESQRTHNIYTSNRLNQPGEWRAQMVISCRYESLGRDYRDRFQPSDRNLQATSEQLQEAVIAPFSRNQIKEYVKQYVSTGTLWQVTDYLQALEMIPSLQDLVKNPFMLTLTMEVLPCMVDPGQTLTSVRVTRVVLYDQFVEQWLERGKRRLRDKNLTSKEQASFERLTDDGFTQNGIDFLKDLACAIYKYQAGYPVVNYSHKRDQGTWKEEFFSRKGEKQLLLEACPMTRIGDQYRFIHKSLLEYCLARSVFDPLDGENARRWAPTQALGRRGSANSVQSFESLADIEESVVPIERAILKSPLAWKSYVSEPSILQFLAERVQQEPVFKHQLLAVIEVSKVNKEARKAAANSITILIRAGVRFDEADLKGIQIPGADLSGGQFDSAQLQGADLRSVNLRNVWLHQANLNNAQMLGARFGESPYLKEDSDVHSCAYSPEGRTCVVGLDNGTIIMYDTKTWIRIHSLHGHTDTVASVTYSPSNCYIASGSWDFTVRLWDAQTGVLGATLSGHTDIVTSVEYSPSGHQIASGSWDETVRLWDAKTGVPGPILSGHTGYVTSVSYSPSGQQIASGSWDGTVRLWDAQTGAPGLILSHHNNVINSVAYSPSGHQLASGGRDKAVRLWDTQTGAPGLILNGHVEYITSVTYSPSGHQIASGSEDRTVRLWDTQTGAPGPILSSHTHFVTGVAYSPSGDQIASGNLDKTVRLWDAHIGAPGSILSGHTNYVSSVTYSPNGHYIASGSKDNTVRIWDAQTGEPGLVLSGHTDSVSSVIYSPSGRQIASGSWDFTMRLWDAQTGEAGPILNGHTGMVSSMTYSPSGHQVASGSYDETVRLWDTQTGTSGPILTGHTALVTSIKYSPNGYQIASGSWDGTVRIWDAQTGTLGLVLSGHTDYITSVIYSPSGNQIASGSDDGTVRLWDAQTGTAGSILSGHTSMVAGVTYSPSGHQIASGSYDETVRLWDALTGAPGHILRGHTNVITNLRYSSSGHQIVSGGEDETVRLWDVESGQCLVAMEEVHGIIRDLAWNSALNGIYFATSYDSSVCTWKIIEEEGHFRKLLHWRSTHDRLSLSSSSFQNVQGLSSINVELLRQRGALGNPTPAFSVM